MELEVKVLDGKTNSKTQIELSDVVFAQAFNEPLVHQVVNAYLAGGRSGNHAQKSRSEVSGGGIKPWRQKGTGRARAGTIRSPIWRGGGVTFAAKPSSYEQKVNKKMYRKAICSILSELIRQGRLIAVETFSMATYKTKDLVMKLKEYDLKDTLIVTEEIEKNLYLASRNLFNVEVCDVAHVNPVNLIGYSKVLVTVPVLRKFAEILG